MPVRSASAEPASGGPAPASRDERRTFALACCAHVLHDGYSDTLYLLLPLWKPEFALGYAAVGAFRSVWSGCMAGLQTPASMLEGRFGARLLLAFGTALAALGYLLGGVSSGVYVLAAALVLGAAGSSAQHPISAVLVSRAFEGSRSRARLGAYNFAGDLGKMALPALTAALLTVVSWRWAMVVLGCAGLAVARVLLLLPRDRPPPAAPRLAAVAAAEGVATRTGRPFHVLLVIGIIDSAARVGFLTFLPFLLRSKGASLPTLGLALTLVFAGGACGKLVCGFLGARLGVIRTVFLTEALTAAGIVALLPLPLTASLALLPLVGVNLNGTSSVLYGSVPELVPGRRRARAFGIFYTGISGGSAVAPVLFGAITDLASIPVMMTVVAACALATLPLAWALRPSFPRPRPEQAS